MATVVVPADGGLGPLEGEDQVAALGGDFRELADVVGVLGATEDVFHAVAHAIAVKVVSGGAGRCIDGFPRGVSCGSVN